MAEHNELGQLGEELARAWLEENGYKVLHQNWRYSSYEIDIIATKGKFLHFVEVKARNYSRYGHPEDNVGRVKFKRLQRAADAYINKNPGHEWIQYNILAITFFTNREPEYFFIEDVFL